jgi:vanillate O-demethylase ferredoxin subunit
MNPKASWQTSTVVATQDLSPTVRQFLLRPASGAATRWVAGAHLQVQVQVNGKLQMRHYSLVGQSDGLHWRIAVKRMDDGRGGSRAMWALRVGETLAVSGPHNHFALDLSAPAYLLIAGGIGITPLVAMAQQLSTLAASTGVPVRMLYGARSQAELAFADDLQAALGPQVQTFVAQEGQQMDFAAEIAALPAKAQLYTCGPVSMLEAIRKAWKAAGRSLADLRFETFGSSGTAPAQAFRVQIPRHQLDITVAADTTLIDALEAAGIETISDCRRGECGLCAMDVVAVQGTIDHRDVFLSETEKQHNQRICVCVSRVVGTLVLDTAWRPDTA